MVRVVSQELSSFKLGIKPTIHEKSCYVFIKNIKNEKNYGGLF